MPRRWTTSCGLILASFLNWSAVAAAPADAHAPREVRISPAGGEVRMYVGDVLVRASSAPISAVHLVDLPGSDGWVVTWDEGADAGAPAHRYAISLDGRRVARAVETTYELKLRHGEFDPAFETPVVHPALTADGACNLHLVQFITQSLPPFVAAVSAEGGVVYNFVARHAYVVRMTPEVRERVAALPFVRAVVPYHPAYRLEEFWRADPDGAGALYPSQRYNIAVLEPGLGQKAAVADAIVALGGVVDRVDAGKFLLEATLTPAQLLAVARRDEVLFIDRWSPGGTDMNVVRDVSGANYVENVAGFTGAGVRGEVIDVGFNVTHVDFASRPLIQHTAVSSDSHGASTSGIVFGDGTGNATGRGLLPAAQGIVADWDVVSTGPARYAHTGELVQSPYFAVFQTASVGSTQVTTYTNISADTDAALFDFDILHCQSQSNLGDQRSRPQAWAKNIVSVGGVYHFGTASKADDAWNGGASIGPAADGRIKPDLCHFYDGIYTVTTGSNNAYTSSFGGTSAATPITAGHFGLFFQMWSEGIFGNPVDPDGTVFDNRPHMTTSKAMMINTASQYAFSGPGHDLTRTHQGWGLPDVKNLYDLRDKMYVRDEEDVLGELDARTFYVEVPAGEPALRVTMVYADLPGTTSANLHRINDLTLQVTAPGGTTYWGNNGLGDGNWSTPGGSPNTVDTVENVFVQDPAAGTWIVVVIADELNADSHVETPEVDADFALVVSGVVSGSVVEPALKIQTPDGVPTLVAPDTATTFAVKIIDGSEVLVPGSARLVYQYAAGGPWVACELTALGGEDFQARLPFFRCEHAPRFYLTAQGDQGTTVTLPAAAPADAYSLAVGVSTEFFADDFQTDQGWTVENVAITTGAWQRAVPVNANRGDPVSDFDGSGMCYVTDNTAQDDVDGGPTRLISPVLDLSAGVDPTLNYARWFTNNSNDADRLDVEVSNDGGGSWTLIESVPNTVGWVYRTVRIRDFLPLTSQMQFRFSATDNPNNSVTEAALDAFLITDFVCDPAPVLVGDTNCDGSVNGQDIESFVVAIGDPCAFNAGYACDVLRADTNGDGSVNGQDISAFLDLLTP